MLITSAFYMCNYNKFNHFVLIHTLYLIIINYIILCMYYTIHTIIYYILYCIKLSWLYRCICVYL